MSIKTKKIFREEGTPALAGFHAGPPAWSNWKVEVDFCGGTRTRVPRENPSEKSKKQQQTQTTSTVSSAYN